LHITEDAPEKTLPREHSVLTTDFQDVFIQHPGNSRLDEASADDSRARNQ